jgi:threonine synthase
MSYLRCLRGTGSGREYPADRLMNLDPEDGRPVEAVLDLDRLARDYPDHGWYQPDRRDMWRFGALLALDVGDPADRQSIVSLGEGATPLDRFAHPAADHVEFDLWVKDEGRPRPGYGANPTLSFKDRGIAMAVSMARHHGVERLAIPTQGNAGDSLAEYALAAGIEAAIVMPDDTPMPVLGRVAALAAMHPGRIHLDLVQGTIREAGRRVKEHWLDRGFFSVATFVEPGWRIEGKKTLGLEIAEPGGAGKRWSLPDVIVYPTGGGTGILGMWKAFDELQSLGLLDGRRPRMVSVQSEATQPLVRALQAGLAEPEPRDPGETVATGVNVAGGVGHFRVLDILRASGGTALAVGEDLIREELRALWQSGRHWICPEGAACLAALEPLAERGVIRPGETVTVVNTASLEKYLPEVRDLLD